MSIFELRHMIESAVPAWVILIPILLVLFVSLIQLTDYLIGKIKK